MKQTQSGVQLPLVAVIRRAFLIFFILILFHIKIVYAQEGQAVYHSVMFFKVNPGKNDQFLNQMREINSKVQQERCKSGHWLGWFFYQVLMPTGSESEYDYTTVSITNKFKNLFEDPYPFDSALHKAFPGQDEKFFDNFYDQSRENRKFVKRQVYGAIGFADSAALQNSRPAQYIELAFMKSKPGRENQYVKMEMDTFRLIHKERIKLNAMSQWGFYSLWMPYNTSTPYNFVCANFYDNLDMMVDGKYPEALKKTFPKVNIDKLFTSIDKNRDMVMAELWKLVLYQQPTQ